MTPALTAEEAEQILWTVINENDHGSYRTTREFMADLMRRLGFTREMVVALRDALACSGTVSSPDNLPLAEEAVDRIETMLRPKEETTFGTIPCGARRGARSPRGRRGQQTGGSVHAEKERG